MGQRIVFPKGKDPRLWENDSIDRIVRVGVKMSKLLKANKISLVKDLVDLPLSKVNKLLERGVRKESLLSTMDRCEHAAPGSYPSLVVDHQKHENPYQSRFPDDYEDRIRQCAALKPYVCVNKMIEWMFLECSGMMKDTEHENDWLFYHDTLALMTANSTQRWMEEKILTELLLNQND